MGGESTTGFSIPPSNTDSLPKWNGFSGSSSINLDLVSWCCSLYIFLFHIYVCNTTREKRKDASFCSPFAISHQNSAPKSYFLPLLNTQMAPSAIAGDTDVSLQTWAAEAPVTAERKLNVDLQEEMHKPYLARAIVAADPAHPDGTVGHEHGNMSVLQQHVAFFDRNHDGVVYPWETYQGLRAIGCGVLLSIAGSFLINLSLSYFTVPGCLPNPLLPIYIKNIHKCKHGSDSESYDTEGRFVPDKFDAIFSKYATAHADALTEDELNKMLKANRNIYDFNGWIMSYTEWKLLYWLAKDEERLLHRDAVRGVYDGSVFEYLEKQNADSHKKKA